MKKTAAVMVAILLLFGISSCSAGTDGGGKTTDRTAAELLETVINSIEFPPTVEITDEDSIKEMGIDLSLTEEYAVVRQMLSVDVAEVIILKVKNGEEDKAEEQLKKRRESLINDFAFYPEQVESANATVVGQEKDVVYLICHIDAETAEAELLKKINAQ